MSPIPSDDDQDFPMAPKKTVSITVRCDEGFFALLSLHSALSGVSVSEYLRSCFISTTHQIQAIPDLLKLDIEDIRPAGERQ